MTSPKTLTPDQCKLLLEALSESMPSEKQQARRTRNVTMTVTMLETGIRVGELCKLHIDDLWYHNDPVASLIVGKDIAKTNEERLIPISQKLNTQLLLMHADIWSWDKSHTTHFAFSGPKPSVWLTIRTVERIILDAGKKAFNQTVTPHMLRHTFATRMMRKTNARIVQTLLGHASLQSTQIYTHPNTEDLFDAIHS
ncbi:hypothetical protein LCGC14_1638400 [marine sediment metagenome]|uniref:Tyr recombinase domain-containing protein n=1 Tax=marine sediment metagenome TaxID=412755 RepID=A0A0F9KG92_9ZZZZ